MFFYFEFVFVFEAARSLCEPTHLSLKELKGNSKKNKKKTSKRKANTQWHWCEALFFRREEVLTEKVIRRRLSMERRSSFEEKPPRLVEKAPEPQHSKGLLSPTRRQRSRTEGILEEDEGSSETRSKVENTPASRVSSRSWAHASQLRRARKLRNLFLPPGRNLWFSGCRGRTASAPSVTSWRGSSRSRAMRRPKAEAPRQPCQSSASPWWIWVCTKQRQTTSRCRGLSRL